MKSMENIVLVCNIHFDMIFNILNFTDQYS